MSNYSRSTVVVIGASARVRRAIARHFASAGWTIGLVARTQALEQIAREVEGWRYKYVFQLEVADAPAIFAAADAVVTRWGICGSMTPR